ncbi:protochlorophyllide reductase [Pseudoscourfieldia marina]
MASGILCRSTHYSRTKHVRRTSHTSGHTRHTSKHRLVIIQAHQSSEDSHHTTCAVQPQLNDVPVGSVSRRSVLASTASAATLAGFLNVPTAALADVDADLLAGIQARGLNVAITGASSGIGLEGARTLYQKGAHVTVLNRNAKRVQDAIDDITAGKSGEGTIGGIVCDLTSLKSVNDAANTLANAPQPIDVLVLNAGVQFTGEEEPRITEDGFEATLQTNHLGHFLLAERLLPTLARSRQMRQAAGIDAPSRIVVTASEVHDPESPGGAVGPGADLGAFEGLVRANAPGAGMVDGGDFDPDKMYKDTKLCNILFTYELARRLTAAGIAPSDISVNTYGPGLITQSGFFRYQNPLFVGLFDFFARNVFRVTESVEGGGALLASMAANPEYYGGSSGYWNNELSGYGGHAFTAMRTSAESYDEDKAARLYDISARLVGVDVNAAEKATVDALRQPKEEEAIALAM